MAKGAIAEPYTKTQILSDVADATGFEFEKIRSLQHLAQVQKQVQEDLDESGGGSDEELRGFKERLAEELSAAVDNEDYERAARLRDRLKGLD